MNNKIFFAADQIFGGLFCHGKNNCLFLLRDILLCLVVQYLQVKCRRKDAKYNNCILDSEKLFTRESIATEETFKLGDISLSNLLFLLGVKRWNSF